MFNTWAWVAWLIAGAFAAFTLRNPLYLVVLLGAAWIVYAALGRSTSVGSSWGSFVKIGIFFFALAIPFNALSIHVGQTILFRLPGNWPIIGGPITLEAVIAGAVSGLALLTILVVFAAFNAVVDHYQLLRATPAFLFHAGVVISISITFVPQMVLGAKEIRQAQRIRGHRFRGMRDLLPLVMPLLANGLERAIQLAETMEARGFGTVVAPISRRQASLSQVGLLVGLLGILAGLFIMAFFSQAGILGPAFILMGLVAVLVVFGTQGRRVRRTRYHRPVWRARDTVVVAASVIVAAAILTAKVLVPETLYYDPFQPASLLRSFNPVVGAALLLLAIPAVLVPNRKQTQTQYTEHGT
jgi:energy-coupling factor transport system permease protein